MTQAKQGDTVHVHYTGKLNDGTIFDSSSGRDPLEFKIGEHRVIPGFEQGVEGMEIGESKTVEIPCDQAYGPRDERMMIQMPRDGSPEDIQVGMQLQLRHQSGQVLNATVAELSETMVTLDGNHPLAGKDLTFDLELVEIG